MGARHPDRIPIVHRYNRGETVGDMIANGWVVISSCDKCQLQMTVRLDWIARLAGPDVSLWNRKERCRRLLCTGFTSFSAKSPDMGQFQVLSIDPKIREP